MKRFTILGALLAGMLVVSGCANVSANAGGTDDKSKPFKLAVITGVTGAFAGIAKTTVDGLNVAVDQINAEGGIRGHQVKLSVLDSESDPTKGVSKFQALVSSGDRPDAVWSTTSPETLAVLPLLTREKIFSLSGSSNPVLNDPVKYPYHFIPNGGVIDSVVALKDQLTKDGVKSFTAIEGTDALGQGGADAITEVFKDSSIKYQILRYNPADLDLTGTYQKALANNSDAIFLDGTTAAAGHLLDARLKLGATDKVTYGSPGMVNTLPTTMVSVDALKNFKASVLKSLVYVPDNERSASLKTLIAKLNPGTTNSLTNQGIVVDGVRMMKAAAEKAGSFDADKMAAAMLTPDPTPAGYFINLPAYAFTDKTHRPAVPPADWAWISPVAIKDGLWTQG